MKNYQSLRYQHYYNQDLDGKCLPVSRKECFAPATPLDPGLRAMMLEDTKNKIEQAKEKKA